jgi:hypothetical protein
MESRPHVAPLNQGPMVNPAIDDRAVDSTPVRMVELRPEETDATTYLVSAPPRPAATHTYLASAHRHAPRVRAYLASAPRQPEPAEAAAPRAIPVSATSAVGAGGDPGTLDYQLSQLNAHRAAEGQPQIQTVADVH